MGLGLRLALGGWMVQVARVYYPGLPTCRDHARAQELFGGLGGGVLAFEVKGGVPAANALLSVRGPH